MQDLKKILTVQNIIIASLIGGGLYLLFKKKEPSDLKIEKISTVNDIPNNTTKEQDKQDCISSTNNMRFGSKKGYDEYISTFVKGKLSL